MLELSREQLVVTNTEFLFVSFQGCAGITMANGEKTFYTI